MLAPGDWQSHSLEAGRAGFHHHHRLGIGEADVLAGANHQPPCDEAHLLAGVEHFREPVNGGIGIAATDAFDESGDRVVMAFVAVVAMFLIPNGRGGRLLNWESAERIPWGMLLLFAGGTLLPTNRLPDVMAGFVALM